VQLLRLSDRDRQPTTNRHHEQRNQRNPRQHYCAGTPRSAGLADAVHVNQLVALKTKTNQQPSSIMQAIITKFLPATNHRGPRVKASCERGSQTVAWDHAFDTESNHRLAASQLLGRFVSEDVHYKCGENPWARTFVTGTLPSGEFVHVFTH